MRLAGLVDFQGQLAGHTQAAAVFRQFVPYANRLGLVVRPQQRRGRLGRPVLFEGLGESAGGDDVAIGIGWPAKGRGVASEFARVINRRAFYFECRG